MALESTENDPSPIPNKHYSTQSEHTPESQTFFLLIAVAQICILMRISCIEVNSDKNVQ